MKRLIFIIICFFLPEAIHVYAKNNVRANGKRPMGTVESNTFKSNSPYPDDIRFNNLSAPNEAVFRQLYQQVDHQGKSSWHVSTVNTVIYTKYLLLKLNIDRGALTGSNNKYLESEMAHRFGINIGQAYTTTGSVFFAVDFSTGHYFPAHSFKFGYCYNTGETTKLALDVYGLGFGEQKLYTSVAFAFIKKYPRHELCLKPYWAASSDSKVNILITDKFFLQQNRGYLAFSVGTGYYPDIDTFIDYSCIQNKRYRLMGEAMLQISNGRIKLLPSLGVERTTNSVGNLHSYWFMQLGARISV